MNRKQAGEDFYFLQKVIPLGGFFEINTTCIYPSPRPSNRVPFGTGPMVRNLVESKTEIQTYPLQVFHDLRVLFSEIESLFLQDKNNVGIFIEKQSEIIKGFLYKNEFQKSIAEINANSPDLIKFNYACEKYYQKQSICTVSAQLAKSINIEICNASEVKSLLIAYRDFEKSNPNRT